MNDTSNTTKESSSPSGNVLPFTPKAPEPACTCDPFLLWVCAECGCCTWKVRSDNVLQCAACENISKDNPSDCWRSQLPQPPQNPKSVDPKSSNIVDYGSKENAIKRTIKNLTNMADPKVIIGIDADGGTYHWTDGYGTPQQRAWYARNILRVLHRVLSKFYQIKP